MLSIGLVKYRNTARCGIKKLIPQYRGIQGAVFAVLSKAAKMQIIVKISMVSLVLGFLCPNFFILSDKTQIKDILSINKISFRLFHMIKVGFSLKSK